MILVNLVQTGLYALERGVLTSRKKNTESGGMKIQMKLILEEEIIAIPVSKFLLNGFIGHWQVLYLAPWLFFNSSGPATTPQQGRSPCGTRPL